MLKMQKHRENENSVIKYYCSEEKKGKRVGGTSALRADVILTEIILFA